MKNLDKLSRPKYEVEVHSDVWMTLRDGVRLCVDVYLPKGARPGSGFGKLVGLQQRNAGGSNVERSRRSLYFLITAWRQEI